MIVPRGDGGFFPEMSISRVEGTMLPPQETEFLNRASDRAGCQCLHTHAHMQILLVDSSLTHTHMQGLFRLCVCVCVFCREKMPFHHVRAGLLYPDNYLSSSLTEGSEAFQLTSISTEELGGECVCVCVAVFGCVCVCVRVCVCEREREREWVGCRVKCEVLAINVSLQEQCAYNAPILQGNFFFI